jgi:hypothetical protein
MPMAAPLAYPTACTILEIVIRRLVAGKVDRERSLRIYHRSKGSSFSKLLFQVISAPLFRSRNSPTFSPLHLLMQKVAESFYVDDMLIARSSRSAVS